MEKLNIKLGYAIDQNTEAVINSANGLLIHDSSGAGRIRELSSSINIKLIEEKLKLLNPEVKNYLMYISKKHNWNMKFANISAINILNLKKCLSLGECVFDEELSKDLNKIIIHAITMSYDVSENPVQRIIGTKESVHKSYYDAILIAIKKKSKSVALPIPIARPGYGLGPKKSLQILFELISEFEDKIQIIVCADNEVTKKYCQKYYKEYINY